MFEGFKARRDARRARAIYEQVRIQGLIDDNNARLVELRQPVECPLCKAADTQGASA